MHADYSGVWGRSRLHRVQNIGDYVKKLVFRSFDQLSVTGSLWNHQKWIPREISRRYRSGEVGKTFFSTKIDEKSWKITKIYSRTPAPPAIYYRDLHCKYWRILKIFAKKKSPNRFVHSECSKRSKNWATYALERIEKDARSNFWVFVSCSKKCNFLVREFSKISKKIQWELP